ncbi:PTS sugar transporter subunit IIA [Necropsobacter massiliensis]
MLAAKDNHSHLDMLAQIAALLSDDESVEKLIQTSAISDIADIIYRY